MRSILTIAKDSQIYNTYGNLPNADLLRRYGYVIPGSKDDLVEISAEMIIQVISKHSEEEIHRRIDILDEEDVYEEYAVECQVNVGLLRFLIQGRYLRRCMCFVWQ
jgi:N-lysine methyltransferase SETD6